MAIYLDNHSTTRLDPRVLEAMLPWLTDHYGNAGSTTHRMGHEARDAVEAAREKFARAVGAEPDEIIFTSGATESVNLAILGAAARRRAAGGRIVSWNAEHRAVLDPLEHLASRQEAEVVLLPVAGRDESVPGLIDLERFREACTSGTFLATLLVANNEIGTIQPAAAVAELIHAAGGMLHLDCAQAIGRMAVDVDALGADLASFSAHKFHGPKGVGALFVRRRFRPARIAGRVFGGGQERGLRSGTLDVPGIVGMGEAAAIAAEGWREEAEAVGRLRDRLWEGLARQVPGVVLNGPPLDDAAVRLTCNLNLHVAGVDGQTLLATLAEEDLALSSGSACSSASPGPSHVLAAIGLGEDEARASLRFGLSRFTRPAEIDRAVDLIAAGVARLRR